MSQILTVPDDVIDRNPPEPPPFDEVEAVRRYGRLLQVSAGAARSLEDLEGRFANETDWVTAPDRFRAEADAIGREFADSFGDDRTGRTIFSRDFAFLANARATAFARASEMREREALLTAYSDRMAGLSEIARGAEGPQRDEALRQAALEAHRAHAFGFESDPTAAVERFIADLQPLRADNPATERFGSPSQVPADRAEYEKRARGGWMLPVSPEAQKPEQPIRSASLSQAGGSFGFPSSELVQHDIDRYTAVQNAGEGDEARSFETIGREYWAAKKALDVDPNDLAAQDRLSRLDRELDLYPIKKLLGGIAFGKGFEKATGLDRLLRFAGKRAKMAWELFDLNDHLDKYMGDRKEIDEIRRR